MKLILCGDCWDLFKLDRDNMRQCKCGKVKGRYLNNVEAEVSDGAISIAIGNGALINAIADAQALQEMSKDTAVREDYIDKAKISHAWIRPNTGPGNPHCKIIN